MFLHRGTATNLDKTYHLCLYYIFLLRQYGNYIKLTCSGKQNSFSVDCSRGGSNVLFVGVYGPDTPCDEVSTSILLEFQ